MVTPYSGGGLSGTKGNTFTVNFNVSYAAAKEAAAGVAEQVLPTLEVADIVNAYPVPMDDKQEIHLEFSRAIQGDVTFTLVSGSGAILEDKQTTIGAPSKEMTIRLGHIHMTQGTYYLRVKGEELKATNVKVVK